jgi:hypothetical protein
MFAPSKTKPEFQGGANCRLWSVCTQLNDVRTLGPTDELRTLIKSVRRILELRGEEPFDLAA